MKICTRCKRKEKEGEEFDDNYIESDSGSSEVFVLCSECNQQVWKFIHGEWN